MKFQRLPGPVGQGYRLVELISVARVRPRTSKGITDLLLPQTSICFNTNSPSKKRSREVIHTQMGQDPSKLHPNHPRVLIEVFRSLFSRLRSRSLTELTRQITPPTTNGHAPPPIESRKSSQICQSSLCLDLVSFPVLSQIKPQAPLLLCPSVNSFKF